MEQFLLTIAIGYKRLWIETITFICFVNRRIEIAHWGKDGKSFEFQILSNQIPLFWLKVKEYLNLSYHNKRVKELWQEPTLVRLWYQKEKFLLSIEFHRLEINIMIKYSVILTFKIIHPDHKFINNNRKWEIHLDLTHQKAKLDKKTIQNY